MSRLLVAVATVVAVALVVPTAPVSAASATTGVRADGATTDPAATDPAATDPAATDTTTPATDPGTSTDDPAGTDSVVESPVPAADGSQPAPQETTAAPTLKVAAQRTSAATTSTSTSTARPVNWSKVALYRPNHYTPPAGARFNNPYGNKTQRRKILAHVIRTINSVPGYKRPWRKGVRVPCPENAPRLYPATIKIALYSIADRAFTDALIRADKRCVSVKIMMNSHLNADTSPSWARLLKHLGHRGSNYYRKRSFAYRCSHGCLGSSVLHTKMFLFSRTYRANHVVMTGSSNMTSNAVKVQWNDMFTVPRNNTFYDQYRTMFNRMVPDHSRGGPWTYRAGRYTSTFYPFYRANSSTDRTMRALRTIKCNGATGGAGINGHSVIYIAMHSWHGTRGKYLAQRVRGMYNSGCYVRILYSFMGKGTYSLLTRNTGRRMVARRVLFAGPRGLVATKYSHMKMFAASGYVGGDTSSWVTWTGSNNWADRSIRADEVTLRVPSRGVYSTYVNHWNFMRKRRSSSVWAIYSEPGGGGRAPVDSEG